MFSPGMVIYLGMVILLIKPRIFNIPIDSSSLNIFLYSFSDFLQTTERPNVF